jgi:hypothetical protein
LLTEFKTVVFRGFASGVGPPGANFGPTINAALRTTLLTLTDASNFPLVWADSNGAARTSWATAVVLMALGVTEDEVIQDYLLTNQFRGAANNAQLNALVGSGRLGKAIYVAPQLSTVLSTFKRRSMKCDGFTARLRSTFIRRSGLPTLNSSRSVRICLRVDCERSQA